MNKTIKTLAIVAAFCFAALSVFPHEVKETAATETVQAAQEAVGTVNHLPFCRVYWP